MALEEDVAGATADIRMSWWREDVQMLARPAVVCRPQQLRPAGRPAGRQV